VRIRMGGRQRIVLLIDAVAGIARRPIHLPWFRRYGGASWILHRLRHLHDKGDKERWLRWLREAPVLVLVQSRLRLVARMKLVRLVRAAASFPPLWGCTTCSCFVRERRIQPIFWPDYEVKVRWNGGYGSTSTNVTSISAGSIAVESGLLDWNCG
jgi:hypothetical protein